MKKTFGIVVKNCFIKYHNKSAGCKKIYKYLLFSGGSLIVLCTNKSNWDAFVKRMKNKFSDHKVFFKQLRFRFC